ncbi:MAG: hypothetical protein P8N65_02580 [SAR86 cluster bacterium]|nr:hypothetical protein [SAR86 cluster bacterium]
MIWIIRLFLLSMTLMYFGIGVWAILSPLFPAVEADYPSITEYIGLTISSTIGYSELAGIYGGLNLGVGILCFIGIFSLNYMKKSLQLLMFLTGSIAAGRIIFSAIPSTPPLVNTFFIFEILTFTFCIFALIFFKPLKNSA